MAIRLTEEEVHIACTEIATQGERPTSLTLLDKIGRGSLTTITKYLNSWNESDNAQAIEAESLPAVVQLPYELTKEGEDLLKKMWHVAKNLTDTELEIQREALKQAEIANQSKVEEAFKFSEVQTVKIERLEESLHDIKEQFDKEFKEHKETITFLNESEKTIVGLSKDNDQYKHEISDLKNQIAALEKANKSFAQENQDLQENYTKELNLKDVEIKSLDMQVHKLQTSLDLSVKSNDQLKTDLKSKTTELSEKTIELEKVGVHLEISLAEVNVLKTDLKNANKMAGNAEKLVAKLEGKLEVYKFLDKPEKRKKDL